MRKTLDTPHGVKFSLAIGCFNSVTNSSDSGTVYVLYFRVLSRFNDTTPRLHPILNETLVQPLLDLPALQWLYMYVYGGQLAPQLGALNLTIFSLNHYCMVGDLPPNLLYVWPQLLTLSITRQGDALDYNDRAIGACGIR